MNRIVQKRTKVRSAGPIDIETGKKIRARRIEQRMSQAELGQKLGVSFQQVQKYEKGVNRVGFARMQKIAEVLEIGIDHFTKPTTRAESELTAMILDLPSQRLLRAFHKVKSPEVRHNFVRLLEGITVEAA